jgi:DNA-binding protein HU-beta
MTKAEMVDKLASNLNMPKAQVSRMVDAFVEAIGNSLASGNKVQIAGLGVFDVRKRAKRKGRNPQDGSVIEIPARNAVGFRAAKSLKDTVK